MHNIGRSILIHTCPFCGSFVRVPVEGDNYIEYTLDTAPLIVIAAVSEDAKKGYISCRACGLSIEILVKFIAYEQQLGMSTLFKRTVREG